MNTGNIGNGMMNDELWRSVNISFSISYFIFIFVGDQKYRYVFIAFLTPGIIRVSCLIKRLSSVANSCLCPYDAGRMLNEYFGDVKGIHSTDLDSPYNGNR